MAISINFGAINVLRVQANSSVNVGENNQPGWSAHHKINNGIGSFHGPAAVTNDIISLNDNDVMDAPVNDPDRSNGVQNQSA